MNKTPPHSVDVVTLGCRLNAYEGDVARGHARDAGLTDTVIINTCAVTNAAVADSRNAIRKARKKRPDAKIIVTGCAAQIDPDGFAKMNEVDHVIGNVEKMLASTFDPEVLSAEKVRVNDIMTVEETAPQLVQYCRDSWAQLNPGWELHLLTKDNLHEYVTLPQYYQDDETFSLAALSDVIRVHLLAAHGGVWADATTFCTRPLDEWIDRCTSDAGIFAYAKPRPTSPIASWFLAAHHDSEIMKVYCNAVDNLWQQFTAGHSYDVQLALFTAPNPVKMAVLEGTFSKQRIWLLGRKIAGLRDAVFKDKKDKTPSNPFNRYYFWFHQVFQVLRICHPTVSTLWDKAPEVTADGPHFVQKNGMCTPITPELDFHITNRMSNMYKLNRREELPDDLNGTAVGLLIDMHLGQPQDT